MKIGSVLSNNNFYTHTSHHHHDSLSFVLLGLLCPRHFSKRKKRKKKKMVLTKDSHFLSGHLQLIARSRQTSAAAAAAATAAAGIKCIHLSQFFFLKASESQFHTADTLFVLFSFYFFARVPLSPHFLQTSSICPPIMKRVSVPLSASHCAPQERCGSVGRIAPFISRVLQINYSAASDQKKRI